jgi:hypothetical protein
MSDTLSTPDPTAQVAEVRHIIEARGSHSCESTLLAIRRVVDPPREPESGWIDTGSGPGAAWERHDDPEQQP